jgi:hypothetical protein
MNLIKFNYREDFGHDWYVQILNTGRHFPKFIKNYSLIQLSISWNDSSGWPYFQICFGSNGFFSILFWVHKFGFDLDILSRTWNFECLEKLDEEFTR